MATQLNSEAKKMLLKKSIKFDDVDLKMQGDAGQFSGYASVFDGLDYYGDTILKGAFLETLAKNGNPKLYFEHSWSTGAALMPIGITKCKEDGKGLFFKGELTPNLSIAGDVYASLKHGTLSQFSIGGFVRPDGFTKNSEGGKVIKKWHMLRDISIVDVAADSAAVVDRESIKSIDFEAVLPECKTERDIERLLRDAGLGKWEAMAIVTRAREIFKGRDAHELTANEALILERLEKLNLNIKG